MKKDIDELTILNVAEFQDYQVLDVVMFGIKYPNWQNLLSDIIVVIEQQLVGGDTDFDLLCNAYEYVKLNFLKNGKIKSYELH